MKPYQVKQQDLAARALAATRGLLVWDSRQGTYANPRKQAQKATSHKRRDELRNSYRAAKRLAERAK